MRQLIYTMHFRGHVSRSADNAAVLKTASSGTSCTMETIVSADGVETTLHPAPGDLAFVESEMRVSGGDAFEGQGILTFGDGGENEVRFKTVQAGHLGSTVLPGMMAGSVSWHVEGGSGRFESAKGVITSTFTLAESGDLNEYHCGLIFLRD